MITVDLLRDWLSSLRDDDELYIDAGGLTIRQIGRSYVYLEIGGEPEDEEGVT